MTMPAFAGCDANIPKVIASDIFPLRTDRKLSKYLLLLKL